MLGLGLGLHRGIFKSAVSYVSSLIKAFKVRVALASGIFEAESCLNTTLTNLDTKGLLTKSSLIVTPNAYKASTLYSVIPNTSLGDMDVVRNTAKTRINSLGLIEIIEPNVPSIDYINGSCPTILVEPQRTNLISYSNSFTNWSTNGVTLTPNYAISPDGTLNATRYQGISGLYLFISYALTANLTHSVYVKSNTGINQNITFGGITASIFVVTNEWKRIDKSIITAETLTQITTNQTTDILIWGAQAEQGSYSTSYIPTTSSTVTRNADVISKTGISSLIGQTEGTLYSNCFLNINVNFPSGIIGIVGTGLNFIYLFYNGNLLSANTYSGGALQNSLTYTIPSSNFYKICLRYKLNDFSLYINGIKISFSTSGIVPLCSSVSYQESGLGINSNNKINNSLIFKTALTEDECIYLTT